MKTRIPWASSQISNFDMRVVLTNLSNQLYNESRSRLNRSAASFGITEIRSYDFEDIRKTSFFQENRAILDSPTGMGYWLWKPYIILEALNELPDGSVVVYCDSGIEVIASLDPLLAICRDESPVVLFGNGDLQNSGWTKRDCFLLMDCDTEYYWKGPQCDAAFALFRKCAQTTQFVREWLEWCRDARIVTDDANTCGKRDLPDFVQHRRDQAVLSLLALKNRLSLFRMPTQYGNHYKLPAFRVDGEFNCVNQYRQTTVGYYAVIPYYNSPYDQLLDHHRSAKTAGGKSRQALPLIVRAVRKRVKRLVNTVSLWLES
jgi:hypothetical protein